MTNGNSEEATGVNLLFPTVLMKTDNASLPAAGYSSGKFDFVVHDRWGGLQLPMPMQS